MIGEIKKFLRDDGIIKVSRSIKELGIKINVESINAKQGDDDNKELIETLFLEDDEQTKIVDKITLQDVVNRLSFRDKQIIKLRYFKDKTQSQVAKVLGISQVHVSRIEKRILKELKNKLLA